MLPMTTPRKRPKGAPSGRKRKPPQRSGKPLNVWLPAELRDALDSLLAQTRRSLTTEVTIALEEYLGKHNLWPPTAPSAEPPSE